MPKPSADEISTIESMIKERPEKTVLEDDFAAGESCTLPTTTPNSPDSRSRILKNPHIFVDSHSSNVPVTAASRGVKRGYGLDRQHAVLLDLESNSDNDDGGTETFNLEAILQRITSQYPNTNFRGYKVALRLHGVTYLDVAAQFSTSWYITKICMSEGQAILFWEWVMRQMTKREEAKLKAKGKKRVHLSSLGDDGPGKENIPPQASSSQQAN
ncbi:hypothetical protein FIBSPDRAFT_952192 [Athelia psychrophila]|uniref:Uncharacterized protein n=1 Tax=Athelia psychrophila TaxID=1759441 RepID=A0A166LM74_9AGAM|nr:hypothetical protein FIBSPDRAFT_952192 [Fibularhizoctonia sp. CBS 109695]